MNGFATFPRPITAARETTIDWHLALSGSVGMISITLKTLRSIFEGYVQVKHKMLLTTFLAGGFLASAPALAKGGEWNKHQPPEPVTDADFR